MPTTTRSPGPDAVAAGPAPQRRGASEPLNVAARVEQPTKDADDGILLAQATLDAITDVALLVEPRGDRELKGRTEPPALYAPTS